MVHDIIFIDSCSFLRNQEVEVHRKSPGLNPEPLDERTLIRLRNTTQHVCGKHSSCSSERKLAHVQRTQSIPHPEALWNVWHYRKLRGTLPVDRKNTATDQTNSPTPPPSFPFYRAVKRSRHLSSHIHMDTIIWIASMRRERWKNTTTNFANTLVKCSIHRTPEYVINYSLI